MMKRRENHVMHIICETGANFLYVIALKHIRVEHFLFTGKFPQLFHFSFLSANSSDSLNKPDWNGGVVVQTNRTYDVPVSLQSFFLPRVLLRRGSQHHRCAVSICFIFFGFHNFKIVLKYFFFVSHKIIIWSNIDEYIEVLSNIRIMNFSCVQFKGTRNSKGGGFLCWSV